MSGTPRQMERLSFGDSRARGALTANRLVLLAAVPLFLILATVAYITVQFAANQSAAQQWVAHTYQVIASLRQVLGDAQDAETGQRGFLLTRRQDFLAPYQAANRRIDRDLSRFKLLTVDNPDEQRRAGVLSALIHDRFASLSLPLAAASGALPSPELLQTMQQGKMRMDALRAEVAAGIAEEQVLLQARNRLRIEQERYEVSFAVGMAVLALGILMIAAAMLVRNNLSLTDAERARANEAAILQATVDTVRDGIAYFTAEGLLCAFNANFFRLLDLPDSLAQIQTTRLSDLQAVEAGRPQPILAPPAEGQGSMDTHHISWGGRELDVYRAHVTTGGFLIVVMDLTARLRAENMVRQSQKMEAIGHLTGGIAHDFNNLLQIISANLDLMVASDEAKGNVTLGQRLQNALGAVSRGSRLTGQLLAFARRQALDPRSVDLGRVIGDMTDLLRRTLGERIEVEAVIAGGLWNTLVDLTQVENAILNLAINARDAMPDGGKLTLEAANAHLDDTYSAGHAEVASGQYVMLAVSDTGTGMPPDVMGRVFEPFFTTKPEGKGTGLGLAQAYGFVKQSGGHIKIYSEIGEGTTVKIYLPRTRRARDAAEPASLLPALGGSERILVVEDDEGVRAAVVDMLTELGYHVLRAENAEAALKLFEGGAKVDLLFTDVVMPGAISTRDFTRQVQAVHPRIKILYTSGYTQNAIVHNGRLDDDAFLLSKPYRKDELARKLRSVFAGTARGPVRTAPPPAQAAAHRGKILVVEDVMLIRMATVDMVEQIGFTAAEAGDGAEALAILRKDPEIEILLTDLGLPGMSGRQLVEEARRLRSDLKVIIASGYSTESAAGGWPDGEITHLTKPFDLGQLRRALGA
jgi:signal transduction histidine kinase/DNA-binding response OmpR family regulator/CHASE3 domain sensor protein